ncbi:REP element-mobilizing transposase RayT [Virgibacillus natechei]|uniref:REP element-mobilizing transposase RayT n=1 Tax=Virgibacillus natechei TaxID=1216297 RepID=A0ABS4IH14_9BACI|nr:transposase [Virgibacillus natechei]MBP1970237.1 REP element-mobilizing transposase RayT [Virgibacillus natechei]UZD12815.1 transposase [Virgibacillus natechei]
MPRKARRASRNGIYHIMLRGVNRQTIFEDDEDRLRLLETIKRFKNISKIKIYSYCLMDNHVHLLIKETEETVSKAIQRISSSYVYWYNNKYERSGHLFQDRFKSENVETISYFLTVLRYIHHNPLKAGLENSVFDCKWTSMNEYLDPTNVVDIDFALQLFSSNRSKAIQLFTDYMQESNDDQCLDDHLKVKTSDSEVRSHLVALGIPNNSILQQMEKKNRDEIISKLKGMNGVSVRQLSRIIGISKSVIDRVR